VLLYVKDAPSFHLFSGRGGKKEKGGKGRGSSVFSALVDGARASNLRPVGKGRKLLPRFISPSRKRVVAPRHVREEEEPSCRLSRKGGPPSSFPIVHEEKREGKEGGKKAACQL